MSDIGFSGAQVVPDWPCANNILAFCTTRAGGFSQGNYAGLNLAIHVNDNPVHVQANRDALNKTGSLPATPLWLQQVHSKCVIHSDEWQTDIQADACITDQKNTVCSILTADCLPVLFCNRQGTKIAAVHAGWRSLLDGILLATVTKLNANNAEDWLVWFGPTISADYFEVGHEVRDAFCQKYADTHGVFKASTRKNHWMMDMVKMAQLQLKSADLNHFYGGQYCTYGDEKRFFSHRRDGSVSNDTGRMATLIWMTEQ